MQNASLLFRSFLFGLLSFSLLIAQQAQAGGIALGATRVIYPAGANQASLSIINSDEKNRFLIQSWVEDKDGNKTTDFLATPPLFVVKPKGENTLRLMHVGASLPTDRESVYWLNVKAIPAVDKRDLQDKNALQLAVLSRIKLFVRPANLPMGADSASTMLRFQQSSNTLTITNPSPYFITLVNLQSGSQKLPNTMVSPKSSASVALPGKASGAVSYQTINDYGAMTPRAMGSGL
ncbi:fimbrial chaperone protein FimC [Pectobacterium punjabense]|uniref:Fimbrial chaperone protein FimC n=1 Tax=Pectobacterium punjabense TaxID=2108399 RepID=A0ABX6L2L6_9GAMM|nr:fimbria/pilus periplasmic chaperone [Pectobacterium punjabense]MBS4431861.1 fimbria/pilus periplasmic chaperone [Pectobacterium punjabense]PTA64001.1 fimbrial chaperone protein FimC [Pectobacterium punjabense]QJA20585.1 fimbrial chaperone protein FimC [Pectobacterium punjabense]